VGNADEGLEFIVTPKVANGAIIYGMIPVKDAAISMINKGFRM